MKWFPPAMGNSSVEIIHQICVRLEKLAGFSGQVVGAGPALPGVQRVFARSQVEFIYQRAGLGGKQYQFVERIPFGCGQLAENFLRFGGGWF